MNRYLTEGVVRDLESGRNITLVSRSATGLAHAYEAITDSTDAWDRISRANGKLTAHHANGAILRAATPREIRGHDCDLLVVLGDIADDEFPHVCAMTNTRKGAEIIGF